MRATNDRKGRAEEFSCKRLVGARGFEPPGTASRSAHLACELHDLAARLVGEDVGRAPLRT